MKTLGRLINGVGLVFFLNEGNTCSAFSSGRFEPGTLVIRDTPVLC